MRRLDQSAFALIVVCTGKGTHPLAQVRQFRRYWTGAGHPLGQDMTNASGAAEACGTNKQGREVYELNCPRCNPRGGGPRWTEATVREALDRFAKKPGKLEWDVSTGLIDYG